jgi:hypothetical protein
MKHWIPLTAAIAALVPSLAHASSEPRRTETGLPERWDTPDVVVVLDPSLEDLGLGTTDAIQAAMRTWYGDVAGVPRIAFVPSASPVGSAYDGMSVISAGTIALAGHENDLAVTTTYASDATGRILEADIVFNTRYAYAAQSAPPTSCVDVFDIGAVATHESGHFFGLGEDYEDTTATMYVTTKPCDAHKRELTAGDTASISALYEQPAELTATCNAAPPRRSVGSNATAAIGLALLMFARKAHRHAAE